MAPYEHKEFEEKELHELDYEDAILYDKRNCCKIFWYTLKHKQAIINTFCVREKLKLFSIKLLILSFSFTCYFTINGFAFDDEYISKKLESDGGKGLFDYFTDSITRIVYTSIVGGLIGIVIGVIFSTDKKIETIAEANKDNKILLKGEISKAYKCNHIIIVAFIIAQFLLSTFFVLYILCFCYVYPNNTLDWFESTLIVIGILQSIPFLTSILISFIKYLSIKCQSEICFKINSYLDEKF